MKVILTGSTGFIGSEVLQQCLQEPAITSVVVLSRRPLASSITDTHSKLKVLIIQDFNSYSQDVLRELQGAEACIWSLGKAVVASDEEAREIKLGYTMAAAKALQQSITSADGSKFRFVFLSGKICERDQTTRLWYMQEHRRIGGLLETQLISFAKDNESTFATYIMKPSMVLSKDSNLQHSILSTIMPVVKVNVLARVMVNVALKGNDRQTFENSDINQHQAF